ncbi:MAG: low-specificity L-threonine aldolase [Hadesarchaea archaeon]|nr:low-specificity L-threonine aldolase [Hadesarchaea archaeon]
MIDLRSDTITKPTPEMREVMTQAKVGDDVYGEDPTVNKLEDKASKIFGMDSALFVPSGTMGNQIAINIHTQPGSEVILDSESHILNFELATMAKFSGAIPRSIDTHENYLPIDKVDEAVRPEKYYISPTDLVTIENTHNMKGGVIYPEGKLKELIKFTKKEEIPIHLDGARIFNASIALGKSVKKITQGINSVMFCLSKGLGAPIGSMLVGNQEFIKKARKIRKQLGGGMRQVGIIASAGIYALENHVDRLKEDHENALILARKLRDLKGIKVQIPETNIVMLQLEKISLGAEELVSKLREEGVLVGTMGKKKIRLVTHLDVTREEVEEASGIISSTIKKVT